MSRMRRLLAIAALCVAAANLPARADYPVAPDVVVFCEPTLRPLMTDLGAQWQKETGVPVRVFAAPTWANLAQLARHARDDVIIGEGDQAAASASAQHLIEADTIVRLWRNRLVVAALARDLQQAHDSSPPVALGLAAVAGKAPVAIVDRGVDIAGDETRQALQATGLWDAVSAKSIGVVGTADAAFLLSQGTVKLAVLYASDVSGRQRFAVTDTLPESDARSIVYWAARTERALSPNTARFLEFLHRRETRERGKEAGLEVVP